ncbi:MAG TPA: hypothetical protein VHC22_10650 [Pirellulales bacterium]|nr:hypothetical protein [Pirellulales bacterium]
MALLLDNSVTLSAGLFRGTAQQWAAGFAPELAREVVSTSRELVQAALVSANGDARRIRDALATIFMSDSRLEAISATEGNQSGFGARACRGRLHPFGRFQAAVSANLENGPRCSGLRSLRAAGRTITRLLGLVRADGATDVPGMPMLDRVAQCQSVGGSVKARQARFLRPARRSAKLRG